MSFEKAVEAKPLVHDTDTLFDIRIIKMREIKFRVWDEQFKRMCKRPEQIRLNIANGNVHGSRSGGNVETWKLMQYTGLKDKNGVEIYEGDILNIYYTSNHYDDTYNHDGVYTAIAGALGDVVFRFERLLWDSYGHNQHPFNSTLSQEYQSLSYRYSEGLGRNELRAIDGSTYFEVIGNIHQNPELLEGDK